MSWTDRHWRSVEDTARSRWASTIWDTYTFCNDIKHQLVWQTTPNQQVHTWIVWRRHLSLVRMIHLCRRWWRTSGPFLVTRSLMILLWWDQAYRRSVEGEGRWSNTAYRLFFDFIYRPCWANIMHIQCRTMIGMDGYWCSRRIALNQHHITAARIWKV